jgi:hypothetical protein
MHDGRVIAGLLLEQSDTAVTLLPNPLKQESRITLSRSDVEEFDASPISTMPMSLLITYSRDEILDLLAFIQSGAQPSSPLFVTGSLQK